MAAVLIAAAAAGCVGEAPVSPEDQEALDAFYDDTVESPDSQPSIDSALAS